MESDERGAGPSASLLLIIGEPFSEDHKTQILAEITKGFRCWDGEETGININDELAAIANSASLGEEGINGERSIQHASQNLTVDILINPLTQSVKNQIKKLLTSPSHLKFIIHAGHVFQDSGAWVLQDDSFEFKHLAQIFKNTEVETALKQNLEACLTIHTLAGNNWGKSISKADVTNVVRIQLNPSEKEDNIQGILQFTAYVGSLIKVVPLSSLLRASEQFGNISFSRPTLYIFPGCQGDSALFGVSGFNLLVNGGYNRRACFWDFARHLDRVDAMLLTHLGADNIFSVNTVLQRKILDNIHPQIGYLYFNVPEKLLQSFGENENGDEGSENESSLLVNLAKEGTKLTSMAKQLGIAPHPSTRDDKAKTVEPVNLYHKLGHGSLDMYCLNPSNDSKEMKEFYAQWMKQAASLGTNGPFSSQNALSVCTLLVWKPYNLNEKIVRILFPGNAPQHKIAEGLEKIKTFDFLKHASCTGKDLLKPVAVKKTRPASSSSSTRPTSRTTSSRMDTQKKTDVRGSRTEAKPSATSPVKSSRTTKEREDITKRLSKPKDVKETRVRVSSATSSARSSVEKKTASSGKSSPSKSPSPPKTSPSKAAPSAKSPTKPSSPVKENKPTSLAKEAEPKSPAKKPSSPVKESTAPAEQQKTPDPVKPVDNLDGSVQEVPAAVPEPPLIDLDQEEIKPQVDPELLEPIQPMTNGNVQAPKEAWVDDLGNSKLSNEDRNAGRFVSNGFDTEEEEIKPLALPDPPVVSMSREEMLEEGSGFGNQSKSLSMDSASTFVFSNDETDYTPDSKPIEQNIQYGISNGNNRAMGALHEVDEEESDEGFGLDSSTASFVERNSFQDEEVNSYKKPKNAHVSFEQKAKEEELQKDEFESLEKYVKESEMDGDEKDASFDPVAEWGAPMGLPSPTPPKRSATSPRKPMTSTTTRTTTTTTSRTGTTTSTSRSTTTRTGSGAASRRPTSSRSSPPSTKLPPMPPVTPFYVDLTYIPNHGDLQYCDVEFFKRVRARYYVLSSLSPNPDVLDSLLEARKTWEKDDLEVTIIPTYDNETLRHWIGLNKEKLQNLHIDVTPAVSRCTIQLQDLETSLPAYRLEV